MLIKKRTYPFLLLIFGLSSVQMSVGQSYFLRDYSPNYGMEVNGLVKSVVETNSGGFYSGSKHINFNERGQLFSIESYSSSAKPLSSGNLEITYTSEGLLKRKIADKDTLLYSYTDDTHLASITYPRSVYHFTYNSEGQLASLEIEDLLGTALSRVIWVYNKKGQIIEEGILKNDEVVSKEEYTLDEQGNRLVRKSANKEIVYKLNAQGGVIERQDKDGEGTIKSTTTYLYTYDEQGNWIEKKVIKKGRVIKSSSRAITYW